MKDIHGIVVPVDFLETTGRLTKYAAHMAEKLSATLHFVHVVHFFPHVAMLGVAYTQECETRLLNAAQEQMTHLVADYRKQFPDCTGEVIVGDPVNKIVEFAKAKKSELIIISTHGAKGLELILLGSVARRVLKQAHCPVLIMNPFKEQ
ncbi:MAG: universal stress protein [Desulforhopalus sp.]